MLFNRFVLSSSLICLGVSSHCQSVAITDSISYAYGVLIGKELTTNFESQGIDIHSDDFVKALVTTLKKDSTNLLMDNLAAEALIQAFFNKRQAEDAEKLEVDRVAEKAKENLWFAQNTDNNPKIIKTNSGLRYEIIKKGKGKKPGITNIATINYKGYFIDGQLFNSSEDSDPAILEVDQVILGWTEALQLMSAGAKYKLYIPFDLGYGAQGAGLGQIPPFTTLIFEIELISFK